MPRLPLLTAALVLAVPTAATAAERHVSPTGAGTDCTLTAPCDVQIGVESAADGDTVIIAPGDYALGNNSLKISATSLTLRGAAPGQAPLLHGSANPLLDVDGVGATVTDLRLSSSANSADTVKVREGGAALRRLQVRSTVGTNQRACSLEATASISDSTCSVAGEGTALRAFNLSGGTIIVVARNVTAHAPNAKSTGILSAASVSSTTDFRVYDSVARGGAPIDFSRDVRANTDGSATPDARLTLYDSNWTSESTNEGSPGAQATITAADPAQTGAPQFADPASGDFRIPETSALRDAGGGLAPGTLDVLGLPRIFGPAVDIGAHEYQPPAPPPVVPDPVPPAPAPAPPAAAPTPVPPAPPAALPKLKAGNVVSLPAARRCVSRRAFRIRVRTPKGARIATVRVKVGKRKAKTYKGSRTRVDLRGLPKGRFTVRVTVTLKDGRRATTTRRYRTCAPRR
jgi:hypothetical protein